MNTPNLSKNFYQLPFRAKVIVGAASYHFEENWQKNAVDFALDVGESIFAAKEGRVISVVDGNGAGGPNKKFLDLTNLVVIEHQQNEYSGYAHLREGILVKPNQRVKSGQLIGYLGRSGYSTYSHLHFQIMIKSSRGEWNTVPTRFKVNGKIRDLGSPKE